MDFGYDYMQPVVNEATADCFASPVLGRVPVQADNESVTLESAIFFGVTDTTSYGTDNSLIFGYYTNFTKWGSNLQMWQYPPRVKRCAPSPPPSPSTALLPMDPQGRP